MTSLSRVEQPLLESDVLRGNPLGDPHVRPVPVYLPPGYNDDPARRYPVIVMLAGYSGTGPFLLNLRPWDESLPQQLDRLIRSGSMPPAIVVMPDCWTYYGGSQYLNSSALGRYEDYLIDEVIPFVDAHYRTLPDRAHRGEARRAVRGEPRRGAGRRARRGDRVRLVLRPALRRLPRDADARVLADRLVGDLPVGGPDRRQQRVDRRLARRVAERQAHVLLPDARVRGRGRAVAF